MLPSLARVVTGGVATVVAAGAAYCDSKDDKYFDPEALERGAKALREIQASPFAKKVTYLTKSSSNHYQCIQM